MSLVVFPFSLVLSALCPLLCFLFHLYYLSYVPWFVSICYLVYHNLYLDFIV